MDAFVTALAQAHALWRYVVIVTGGISVGRMLMGWIRQDQWQPLDERLGSFFVTAIDVGVTLGLLVWLLQGRWDGADLLHSWRHPGVMLVGLLTAHYGWRRIKQMPLDGGRFGRALLFWGLTGVILLVGILQVQGVF